MKKSTRLLITAAAIAGLYAGTAATRAFADDTAGKSDSSKDGTKAAGQHDCKGKNSCAGQGGCKTSDNGCKAKNSCAGKGGCSTATTSSSGKVAA